MTPAEQKELQNRIQTYASWSLIELRNEIDNRGHCWHPDANEDELCRNLAEDDTGLHEAWDIVAVMDREEDEAHEYGEIGETEREPEHL